MLPLAVSLGVLKPASTVSYLRWSQTAKRPSRRGVYRRFDRAFLLIAHDADGELVFVRVAQAAEKVVPRPDRPAIDRRDDVSRLQPRAGGGRAVRDRRDEQAVFRAEVLRELIGQLIDRHAETAA